LCVQSKQAALKQTAPGCATVKAALTWADQTWFDDAEARIAAAATVLQANYMGAYSWVLNATWAASNPRRVAHLGDWSVYTKPGWQRNHWHGNWSATWEDVVRASQGLSVSALASTTSPQAVKAQGELGIVA
jgi:hypothetical protein